MTRLLVISDLHCGHEVGLTAPSHDVTGGKRLARLSPMRKTIYKWAVKTIDALRPIDVLLVNGDAIDGRGDKSGGLEQIEADRSEQVEMATQFIKLIKPKHTVMAYGCLTPGQRILTADLRWDAVENMKAGDRIMAFDEFPNAGNRRKIFSTKVAANKVVEKSTYLLHFSDGTSIEASEEHPFLVPIGGKYDWRTVFQLYSWLYNSETGERYNRGPLRFPRFLPTWHTGFSYGAGYLSGFFDGEGSLSQCSKDNRSGWPEHVFALHGYQNDNECLARTIEYLDLFGFNYAVQHRDRTNKMIQMLGGRWEGMRFLGSIRPPRLLAKFNPDILGTLKNPYDNDLMLVGIEPLGIQEVCAMGTESGTYISEGFLSHNTGYHTGNKEDWENDIAKKVDARIESEGNVEILGNVINYRHHLGRSAIPHGRVTAVLRERLWNEEWAARGEYPRANIIIRSHVHYHYYGGNTDFLALTTPALQGYGTKYGTRRVSGTVDIGMVVFDIRGHRDYTWHAPILRLKLHKPLQLSAT